MKEKVLLEQEIEKGAFNKGGEVSSRLKDMLRRLGINPGIIRKISIVTYELEMNIIIHSWGGKIKAEINQKNISIIAKDKGPGIKDIEKAFEPGYSTAGEKIREMGFGAGMGLNNVKTYSDTVNVETDIENGTILEAVINLD
ncbi:MAG: ATP-binding protein [Halanaerobiales bacterium]